MFSLEKIQMIDVLPEELTEARFMDVARAEVENSLTRSTRNLNQGLTVEGAPMREYSPGYKAMREAEGLSGFTNLQRTSKMVMSRSTDVVGNEALGIFLGGHHSGQTNAELAEDLESRGFVDWHAFSEEDLRLHQEAMTAELERVLDDALIER